jgi:hypothetical protein
MDEKIFFIEDLPTLQVISDPLRLAIFKKISATNQEGGLASAKRLSEQLHIPQTKLYYHLKMLEQHQIIEVADTRMVSGIQEKLYRVCALRIMVSERLLSGAPSERQSLLTFATSLFQTSLEEMQNSFRSSEEPQNQIVLGLLRKTACLSSTQAQDFSVRLEKLVEEFVGTGSSRVEEGLTNYALLLALYPLAAEQNVNVDEKPALRAQNEGDQ